MINLTPGQLRRAADIKERIDALQNELSKLLGSEAPAPAADPEKPKKRKFSAAGRRAIAAAARLRWAKYNAAKGGAKAVEPVKKAKKKKRKMTAAWRRALARAHKARRAQAKAARKAKL